MIPLHGEILLGNVLESPPADEEAAEEDDGGKEELTGMEENEQELSEERIGR